MSVAYIIIGLLICLSLPAFLRYQIDEHPWIERVIRAVGGMLMVYGIIVTFIN